MSLVSDDEAPEAVDPGEGALDDPPVLSEMAAAFDASSGDARGDGARPQVAPAPIEVVGLVGMEFDGSPAWSTALLPNRPDGVDDCGQSHAVVAIGSGQDDGERNAGAIDHDVALGPRLAAIGRVRSRLLAPLFAGTEDASTEARDQSICPARFSRSSMWRWISSHKPASCQARNRRQQVMPEQPATSNGNRSHGIAV